jgi:RimJ/RimL family protein N-acetyltransferase
MADTTLKREVDKLNCEVTIKFCDSLGGSPLIPLFMKNFSKLMEDGHSHYHFAGHNRCKAIYAEIDGKIVGHVVFEVLDDVFKTAWVILSVIDADYQRRGLYTMMHRHLEEQAKRLGAKKIASNVHVDNVAMKLSCEQLGRKPIYYRMEKDLE